MEEIFLLQSQDLLNEIVKSIRIQIDSVLFATVVEALSQDSFLVEIGNVQIPVTSNVPLTPGERVFLRVKDVSDRALALELVRAPKKDEASARAPRLTEEDLLRNLSVEPTPRNLKIFRALIRFELPVTRAAVEKVANVVRDASDGDVKAAALLMKYEFEPTRDLVERLSRLERPPAIPEPQTLALMQAISDFVREATVEEPQDAPAVERAVKTVQSPQRAFDNAAQAVVKALESDPQLVAIERLILAVDDIEEKPQAAAPDVAALKELAARAVQAKTEDEFVPLLREFVERVRQSRKNISEIRQALVEMERERLDTLIHLVAGKAQAKELLDFADRFVAHRIINQAAALHRDGFVALEFPVRMGNETAMASLRVVDRRKGKKRREKDRMTLSISVDVSALGRVSADASLAGKEVSITFFVRDSTLKRLFDAHLPELVRVLEGHGYKARAGVSVRRDAAPSVLDHFATGSGSVTFVDLHA